MERRAGLSRRWPALGAAVVAALLVVLVLVAQAGPMDRADEPSAHRGSSSGAPPVSGADRDTAIREILDRRAAAVLDRDRVGFLADLDPAAVDFRRAQQRLFDNLASLDFAEFRYEAIGRDFHRPELVEQYGLPTYVAAVLLHYRIEGYDRAPVARPHGLTFVLRGDRWVLASDSDVDRELPETGHADPWDRRPIVVREGEHVLLIGDRSHKGRLGSVLRAAEQAVRRVARMWPDGWRRRVVVVAVDDPLVLETYFRTALQTSDRVAAIAVPAYDVVPGWSPESAEEVESRHPARSRVILNPRFFDPADEDNRDLLTHEITHVATQRDNWAGAPTWLVEGVAEYTAYRHLRPFALDLRPSLRRQVRAGSVHLPTYEFYQRQVAANYMAAFVACAWVADEYGEETLRTLHRRLGRTPTEAQTLDRTRRLLRKVLGVSLEEFQADVADYAAVLAARA